MVTSPSNGITRDRNSCEAFDAIGNAENSTKKVKKFMKQYPIARKVKKRVEKTIKQDAAKEFLKLRESSGGVTRSCDVEFIVSMYNIIGYPYITKAVVLYEARVLRGEKSAIRKRATQKRSIESDEDKNENGRIEDVEQVPESEVDDWENTSTIGRSNNKGSNANVSNSSTEDRPVESRNDKSSDSESHNLDSDFVQLMSHGAAPLEWPSSDVEAQPVSTRKKGGRPKGTLHRKPPKPTNDDKLSVVKSKLVQELTTRATQRYMIERLKSRNDNKRIPKGTLAQIVQELEDEGGLPPNTINTKTVLSRMSSNNITGIHSQQQPILQQIEMDVVRYAAQLAKMGQALFKDQVTSIAQTLVRRNNLESHLLSIRKERKWVDENIDEEHEEAAIVGSSWFKGFMNRHQEEITAEVGHELRYVRRYFMLRQEHFKNMYDIVYNNMVLAGVAEKFQRPVLFDVDGNRVPINDREWAYGLPTKYRMTRPECFLIVDQLGYRDKDVHQVGNYYNHVDGQSFLLQVEDRSGAVVEMKFSVYCFCNGFGNAVLCAVVLMSDKKVEELPISVRYGIDVFKPLREGATEVELLERNSGMGLAMQGGPRCVYRDKEIPCYVGTSPTGVMTSDILLGICKLLDEVGIYDRGNGTKPFMLLDGHGCVLEASLLDYIATNEWALTCGCHNETHILNLADSNEFNKSFRGEFANAKARLLESRAIGRRKFYASDVMPLVNHAWSSTLGLPGSCKRPLSIRGWNPMNYAWLLHPALNKKESTLGSEKKTPSTQNGGV